MNRSLRDSVGGNIPLQHRRGLSLNGVPNPKDSSLDENLDLFSKSRRSLSVASADESDASLKLGRLSLGSAAKQGKSGLDDFLSSADGGGKHDYDWLLTPPGTPLVPPDGKESQPSSMAPRNAPAVRSMSTTKASRLSVSQTERNHAARPTRSSSVMRPCASSSQYSNSNKSTSILNTSSASVSSYIRPSTPTNRSSSTRPSTASARPTVSRPTTPSKSHPAISTPSVDKSRPSRSSRPSTPTSRPQVSTNLNSPTFRTTARSSTPTRRNSAPTLSHVSVPSTPGGRGLLNGRSAGSVSRPSSPGPRIRTSPQPISLPDFPLETPPNLRTTLPDRPISAGRSRPGVGSAAKWNAEPTTDIAVGPRRQSSPIVSRGRLAEPPGRIRTLPNGHLNDAADSRREPTRKPVKTSTDSKGLGRTISKKSLDMAIRHMDIRNSSNVFRPLSGSNLFPQSIRGGSQKSQPGAVSVNGNLPIISNGYIAENGNHNHHCERGGEDDKSQSLAKLTNNDIYESSRYDVILLKEDLKNTSWLHSSDDKSEQGPIFDNGFELIPELFDPL